MAIINKLSEQGITINFQLLYVLLKEELINSPSLFSSLNKSAFEDLNQDQINQLYLAEDAPTEDLCNAIKEILSITNSEYEALRELIAIADMYSDLNKDIDVQTQLNQIEYWWVKMGRPTHWKNFIYYMPSDKNGSPDKIISKFKIYAEDYLRKHSSSSDLI